ncbi:hypothetical protein F511_29798 [Dorcoceras hygrometricum]|uniref:Uncharacterized protein n=1 Tax=Dorcoceras hygrometricum TaxID=472368 RepID=A0A2Z7BWT7_9LAMI|nr:hypothetical protein F511_29798 [Dorcoceras hygrometricum]
MFKSLVELGLRGFLGAFASVFEGALTEFFAKASVIAGTIVSTMAKRKIVIMKDVFAKMFHLPIEGMMFRLLHDIAAKSLSAKTGSFDVVTTEKFEMMVAISSGMKIDWGHILFQTLVSMVYMPGKQSQGYIVQLSLLMEKLEIKTQKAALSQDLNYFRKETQEGINTLSAQLSETLPTLIEGVMTKRGKRVAEVRRLMIEADLVKVAVEVNI